MHTTDSCGFCGKLRQDVKLLIKGLESNTICNSCVLFAANTVISHQESAHQLIAEKNAIIEKLQAEITSYKGVREIIMEAALKLPWPLNQPPSVNPAIASGHVDQETT